MIYVRLDKRIVLLWGYYKSIYSLIENNISYDEIYKEVFSNVIREVTELFKQLNIDFSYYDPDLDYKEDVEAFLRALKENIQAVEKNVTFYND